MGTVKIELDIPNFDKELNINLTIRKDGEVVYTTSQPEGCSCEKKKEEKPKAKKALEGNLMDMTF